MLFKTIDWDFAIHIFVLGLPVRFRRCPRIFDRSTGTFFDVWNQLDLRGIRAKIEGGLLDSISLCRGGTFSVNPWAFSSERRTDVLRRSYGRLGSEVPLEIEKPTGPIGKRWAFPGPSFSTGT